MYALTTKKSALKCDYAMARSAMNRSLNVNVVCIKTAE